MADSAPEKSRGLRFAERQLLRHGWEHGKGLGRDENGISEAIKVKVKCDKGGVGHKEGDQFTFHWWDHVFNKTSASLEVQADATLRKNAADDTGAVSNRKPSRASLAKDRLYGAFVKSATLVSGREVASSSGSDSDSDSDSDLDLSSTARLSDAQLVKACGGRTAHKGARHGLKMSAKLARLEQQEAEFMAKYGNKTQVAKGGGEAAGSEGNAEVKEKKKKKKKSKECEEVEGEAENGLAEEVRIKKKKKNKACEEVEGDAENGHIEEVRIKKKKSKECELVEGEAENRLTEEVTIKKKKKKKKDSVEEGSQMEEDQEMPPPKKKKKKKTKE